MDLLEAIQNDVLKQKEEEALNNFASVAQFREFISSTNPDADVSVSLMSDSVVMGVTLIDAKQRGVFEPTADALNDLTPLKRKPYLAQVTVWDARPKKGVFGKTNIDFQPGAVYKFCHVDGVGFFADIAKGNVEYERGNNDKIYEVEPPLKKRKLTRELASQPGKHKLIHRLQVRRPRRSPKMW
ncbi:NADH-cytochrome b5 reductase [Phytophthora nicotianae]|uniref:NADH-cytochrome b5 reductase n=1 Tax=Phytophthora nicotianae TaxID=4792 RepID=A0A0W8CI71_PHYNI|nr:NADH-cytochrome b5 reductase [Phytophthora nicotianae]